MSESSSSKIPDRLVCANHPQRETLLRCNRCDKPICSECVVLTPTGYRCKECLRSQQKAFETARWLDFPLAIFIALAVSFLGSYVARVMQFFTIFIAPIVGFIIAEGIRWIVRRRRSKLLYQLSAAGAAVGSLPLLVAAVVNLVFFLSFSKGFSIGYLLPIVWQVLYSFLVTTTSYYRLSGIEIR